MMKHHNNNDNKRGRCLFDVLAEAGGIPVCVFKARFVVAGWLNIDMPPNMTCDGLGNIFGDNLPEIAAQCLRDDDVDRMIRVASRHHQRAGAI